MGRNARLGRTIIGLASVTVLTASCRITRADPYVVGSENIPALRLEAIEAATGRSASLEILRLQRALRSGHSLSEDAWAASKLRIAALQARLGEPESTLASVQSVLERVPAPSPRARAISGLIGGRALVELGRHEDARVFFAKAREASDRASLSDALARASSALTKAAPRAPGASRVAFVSRARWGARRPRVDRMEPMGRPTRMTIHHSALWCSNAARRGHDLARIFQRNHMDQRGWGDLGYHWLIDRSGRILEGRNLRYQGAHAGNGERNRQNVGICLLGNFEPGSEERSQRPTPEQLASLESLVRMHAAEWSIPPSRIYTHREIHPRGVGATACPGRFLTPFVAQLRERLQTQLADGGQ